MPQTGTYGKTSESIVTQYLRDHGYHICDTNYTTRHGEIDIVACTHDLYIFVEVKARKQPTFAISTTITPRKQNKIIRTAQTYIHAHSISEYNIRFDVALVSGSSVSSYIPAAFTPEDMML